jgi:hypothetical protein
MIKKIAAALALAVVAALGASAPAVAAGKVVPTVPPGAGAAHRALSTLTTCETLCYYYEGAQDTAVPAGTTGVYLAADIAKPTLNTTTDYHTLWEMDVRNTGITDTIELGWTVDPSLNAGSTNPYLFVSRWINGVFKGYNTADPGFHPCGPSNTSCTTAPTVGAGQSVNAAVGLTKKFGIEYFNSKWWLSYDNQWVGWYAGSDWSPAFTTVNVTQGFGEVASKVDYTLGAGHQPCSQMGNGNPGSGTLAARQGGLTYIGSTAVGFNGTINSPATPYYSNHLYPTSSRSQYYGGDNTSC